MIDNLRACQRLLIVEGLICFPACYNEDLTFLRRFPKKSLEKVLMLLVPLRRSTVQIEICPQRRELEKVVLSELFETS